MKNIITIGGGTGNYNVLTGLRNLENISISALVSMSDDGGSSGILRDELGVLPPGDVRQCLVALSAESDILRKLMNYRFTEGGLSGHTFGNIFLAALEKTTGGFKEGVEILSQILKLKGKVVPITSDNAVLCLETGGGKLLEGQMNISNENFQNVGFKKVFYKVPVVLNTNAKNVMLEADYIVISPGDFFCSIVPNFIVEGFKESLKASRALIVFMVNITNKEGNTGYWKVSDYVKNVEIFLGRKVDFILVNEGVLSKEQIETYKIVSGDGVLVEDDFNDVRVIRRDLVSHTVVLPSKSDTVVRSFIRHEPLKVAQALGEIFNQ